jgi:cell division septal protein FtsQ
MRPGFLKRRFGKIVILLILIIILSCSVFFIAKNIFTIRYIEVEGTDVLVSIDEKRLSKNLLFFPVEKFRSEIVKSNPVLQDVRFEKKYPHTLKIIPVVRTPFVRLSSGGRLVLLDKEGVVLQDGDRELSIPLLTLTVPLFHVGETLKDESVQFLLAFVLNMNTLLLISSITQTDSAYYQVKTGITDIYITQGKPIGETTSTLQTLIAGFRIKGTLPAVVDLRFDKPIIKI